MSRKVNRIAQREFELTHVDSAVHYFKPRRIPPISRIATINSPVCSKFYGFKPIEY